MINIIYENINFFQSSETSSELDGEDKQDKLFVLLVLILNNFIKVKEIQTEENKKLLNQISNLILDTLVPEEISNSPELNRYNSSDLLELLSNEEVKYLISTKDRRKFIEAVKVMIYNKSGFDSDLLSKLESEFYNHLL